MPPRDFEQSAERVLLISSIKHPALMQVRITFLPMANERWPVAVEAIIYVGALALAFSTAFIPLITLAIRGWGNVLWWCVIWGGFLLTACRLRTRGWFLAAIVASELLALWPIYQFITPGVSGGRWKLSVGDGWSVSSYVLQVIYYLICFTLAGYALNLRQDSRDFHNQDYRDS